MAAEPLLNEYGRSADAYTVDDFGFGGAQDAPSAFSQARHQPRRVETGVFWTRLFSALAVFAGVLKALDGTILLGVVLVHS